jgi:hypothetical protein
MYTSEQITKALEAYTSVQGIDFNITQFLNILSKLASRQAVEVNDPMEKNLCDSCQ